MSPKLKKTFKPGEVKTLNLRITNQARDRQPIHFEVKDVPEDWGVLLDNEDLVLDGQAEGILQVSIRAPDPPAEKAKVGMRLISTPELEPDKKTEIAILAKLKPDKDQLPENWDTGDEEDSGGFSLFGGGDDEEQEEEGPERSVIQANPRSQALETPEPAEPETEETEPLEATEPVPEPEPEPVEETAPEPEPAPPAPPEPDQVVEYREEQVREHLGLFPASDIYHVTHIPLGNGTMLKFREQVQVVLRPREDDAGKPFRERMDVDALLADLIESGYVEIVGQP